MDDENIVLPIKFYRTDSGREPVRDWLKVFRLKTVNVSVKTSKQCSSAGRWGCLWLENSVVICGKYDQPCKMALRVSCSR